MKTLTVADNMTLYIENPKITKLLKLLNPKNQKIIRANQ